MYTVCIFVCIGGYGYVFVAQDTQSGKEYALKVHIIRVHAYTVYIVYTSVHFALSGPNHYEASF